MLYLRPLTESLAIQKVFKNKKRPLIRQELRGSVYSRMPAVSKRFLINLLSKHENWHDRDHVRTGADERMV